MKHLLLTLLAAAAAFAASPLAGTWKSTVDFGDEAVHLALVITDDVGVLTASMTNENNGKRVQVDSVEFGDRKIALRIPEHNGTYYGTVVGGTINGYWTVGKKAVPLNFQRDDHPTVTLSPAERDFAISYLEKTRKEFLDSIRGLNAAQWGFKPSGGGWSIAECAEHITTAEDLLYGLITGRILKAPVDPQAVRSGTQHDAEIIAGMTDRSTKAKAPEILKPSGKYPTPESVLSAFAEKRTRSVELVKKTQEDLRGRVTPNPQFKTVDAYQYVLFMAAHSSRHTAQLNEVKTDAGYPK